MKANLFERGIMTLFPKVGFERAKFRAAAEVIETKRSYDAASFGRRTKNWKSSGSSATREVQMSLMTLRNRSRELTRNNPYAARAIQAISANVISTGIVPVPFFLEENKAAEKIVKNLWSAWADTTECDFDGQSNFVGLQLLAARCIAESGEVLIRKRKVKDGIIPLKLQLLEPDFLDTNKDTGAIIIGQRFVMQGIQFDKKGQVEGYWIHNQHPGDGWTQDSEFVDKEDICHVFFKERPGQIRGVPRGVASFLSMYDLDEYETAQLIRQKIASCFTIFITDNAGDGDVSKDALEKVEPGIIEYISGNRTVQFADPPGVQNYDEYTRGVLRKIAVGYGVPYEILTGDLSNVNFSSARLGFIEFRRLIGGWQRLMFVPMMCDPIWKWFVTAAQIAGKLKVDVYARWTTPRLEMIDPGKEIKAYGEAIRYGLNSWQNVVRETTGRDHDDLMEEMKADAATFDEAGLMPLCDPRFDVNRGVDAPVDGTKDKTKKKTDKNRWDQ